MKSLWKGLIHSRGDQNPPRNGSIHCLPISHAEKLSLGSQWYAQGPVIREAMWKWKSEREGCSSTQGTSKIASGHQKQQRTQQRFSPITLAQEKATLLTATSEWTQDQTHHLLCPWPCHISGKWTMIILDHYTLQDAHEMHECPRNAASWPPLHNLHRRGSNTGGPSEEDRAMLRTWRFIC